jgi:hypothetical protein
VGEFFFTPHFFWKLFTIIVRKQNQLISNLIFQENFMRKTLFLVFVSAFLSLSVSAQNADEIIAKYVKAIGGMDKIKAVKTIKSTGKYIGGGGFQAKIVEEKNATTQFDKNLYCKEWC